MVVVELKKCLDVDLPEGGINASTLVLELKWLTMKQTLDKWLKGTNQRCP